MRDRVVRSILALVAIVVLVLVPAAPALADGIIIPEPPPDVPIADVPFLTIKYHRVTVTIEDQVATTRVDQVFVNEGNHEVEGTYIFPLPEEAAIGQFSMWVDGEKLAGQVLKREEARRIYEEIVRSRRDPALLEYVGRDAFQANIFPIPPGGERRVELEYSQVLAMDKGLIQYVYPLNTEKFSLRPLEEVTVNVTLRSKESLKAIYSPSHDVDIERQGDHEAVVGYEEMDVKPDRDFVLYYTVSPEDVGVNLLSYRPGDQGEGFFLLLAAPRVEVESQQVIAKDVILVLDTSGSMRGEKIEQAKEALRFVLASLNEGDRFNVIAFGTTTHPYARGLVEAGERDEARSFVDRLEAGGSTDINRALLESLDMVDDSRPAIVIFLTDGLPTVGEVDADRIIANVGDATPKNARIFPFGVGYDVNTFLLDTVAQNHRGVSGYVLPEEAIDEKVSAFYAKVSTPVLADLEIDFGAVEVEEIYPYPLPDLFAGAQLVVVGRYREGGQTAIELRGIVNDRQNVFRYEGVSLRDDGGPEFIARLWATRKIGYLLQEIRLHGEEKELIDEIVELSIRYGIITPYTSFLVEETERALTAAGREDLSREVQAASTALPPPTSGQSAVERSAGEQKLAEAAAPSLAPGLGAGEADEYGNRVSPVKVVGDKTFVLNNGVWTDTTFDPNTMTAVPIGFGSDDYFALLAARPEWGRYLALGDHVIAVLDGTAYEIREGEAPPLEIPAVATPGSPTALPTTQPGTDEPGGLFEVIVKALQEVIAEIVDWFTR